MYVRDINNLFCNFSLEQHCTVDYQIKFEHKGSECDVIYATIQSLQMVNAVYSVYTLLYTLHSTHTCWCSLYIYVLYCKWHEGRKNVHYTKHNLNLPLKTEPAMDSWSGCYGIYLAFVYTCIFGPQNQTYAVASALTVTSSAFMRSYRLFWDSVYILLVWGVTDYFGTVCIFTRMRSYRLFWDSVYILLVCGIRQ